MSAESEGGAFRGARTPAGGTKKRGVKSRVCSLEGGSGVRRKEKSPSKTGGSENRT